MTLTAHSFYGRQNLLYIAACADGVLSAIGAKSGGLHGFNRYSTWFPDASGTLVEQDIPYTLFGGGDGINVTRVAVGPHGLVYVGNRSSGAAVWLSTTGQTQELLEGVVPLASDVVRQTWAADVESYGGGWVVVGAVTPARAGVRAPGVWTSVDGRIWHQVPVPDPGGYADPQRVAVIGSNAVMIGPHGGGYSAWRGTATGQDWVLTGSFGSNGDGAGLATGLVAVAGVLYATVSDASAYHLYRSADLGRTWTPVSMPITAPSRFDTYAAVFSNGRNLWLVVDDGHGSRIWCPCAVPAGSLVGHSSMSN
jgi:hypothetical protein